MVYWTYSKPLGDGLSATAAARGRLSEDRHGDRGGDRHLRADAAVADRQALRLAGAVRRRRALYVTTGEHSRAEERGLAQDLATATAR